MEKNENIRKWYNNYSKAQSKTGINLRHFKIMSHLLDAGLNKSSSILEVGCGIGTLTELLNSFLKRGIIVATDISNESVSIARKRLNKSKNIRFIITDMRDFEYDKRFDFIVLPDVLEHIPIEQHRDLFQILARHMHEKSVLLIHIPHPKALDYIREFTPEKLQIIDQSLSADELLKHAYMNALVLTSYISYSIFNNEADYAVIRFQKDCKITLTPLPKIIIILRKMRARIKFYMAILMTSIK